MKKKTSCLIGLAAMPALCFIAVACFLFSQRGHIGPPTVGPDTTFLDGPLKPNGYVDYFAAYNEFRGEQVPPEENGAIELLLACGLDSKQVDEHFLGAWELITRDLPKDDPRRNIPDDHRFFVDLETHLASIGIEDGPDNSDAASNAKTIYEAYDDQFTACMTDPWKASDYPVVNDWIKHNDKPLALLTAASKYDKFWMPAFPWPDSSPAPVLIETDVNALHNLRKSSPCLVVRAMMKLGNRDIESCQDDLIAARRLCTLVTQNSDPVNTLIGIAELNSVDVAESRMLSHTPLTLNQIERYEKLLDAVPEFGTLSEMIEIEERLAALSSMQFVHQGDSTFDINVSLQRVNEVYDHLEAATRKPPVAESVVWLNEYVDDMESSEISTMQFLAGRKSRAKVMAKVTMNLMLPATLPMARSLKRKQLRLMMVRTGLKIAKFRIAEGRYPESLDELVPEYFVDLPDDPYNEGPLQYRVSDDGYLLYSFGYNQTDNNGLTFSDTSDMSTDDIVLQVGPLDSIDSRKKQDDQQH